MLPGREGRSQVLIQYNIRRNKNARKSPNHWMASDPPPPIAVAITNAYMVATAGA